MSEENVDLVLQFIQPAPEVDFVPLNLRRWVTASPALPVVRAEFYATTHAEARVALGLAD